MKATVYRLAVSTTTLLSLACSLGAARKWR